jgi:MerR family transcriptional regulator/heat shock protein HspR
VTGPGRRGPAGGDPSGGIPSGGSPSGTRSGGGSAAGTPSGGSASRGHPAGGGPSAGQQGSRGFEMDAPLFVISVAAQLAGMHAQTLRSYDREGLVSPGRTTGGGRRYSQRDIELLREVQRLSQDEGVNRAGIRRIIELEALVDVLREQLADATSEIASLRADLMESRMDAANAAANAIAGLRRDVVPWREPNTALVAWRRQRRS